MRTSTFGIALIILGIIMFVYTGVNFTNEKKVVVPVHADSEASQLIQWSPAVGVLFVLAGIVFMVRGRKRLP